MGLSDYLSGYYGITRISDYFFAFILTINPAIFKLMRKRNYWLFFMGVALSAINHRAIVPFVMLIILDLDYEKLDEKWLKTLIRFSLLTFLFYGIAQGVA